LGISRKIFSRVVNGHGSITPDMAQRLGRAFDTGPELWLNLQSARDLWDSEHTPGDWQKVMSLPDLAATGQQPS
jgi:addiction module HigA family antidote